MDSYSTMDESSSNPPDDGNDDDDDDDEDDVLGSQIYQQSDTARFWRQQRTKITASTATCAETNSNCLQTNDEEGDDEDQHDVVTECAPEDNMMTQNEDRADCKMETGNVVNLNQEANKEEVDASAESSAGKFIVVLVVQKHERIHYSLIFDFTVDTNDINATTSANNRSDATNSAIFSHISGEDEGVGINAAAAAASQEEKTLPSTIICAPRGSMVKTSYNAARPNNKRKQRRTVFDNVERAIAKRSRGTWDPLDTLAMVAPEENNGNEDIAVGGTALKTGEINVDTANTPSNITIRNTSASRLAAAAVGTGKMSVYTTGKDTLNAQTSAVTPEAKYGSVRNVDGVPRDGLGYNTNIELVSRQRAYDNVERAKITLGSMRIQTSTTSEETKGDILEIYNGLEEFVRAARGSGVFRGHSEGTRKNILPRGTAVCSEFTEPTEEPFKQSSEKPRSSYPGKVDKGDVAFGVVYYTVDFVDGKKQKRIPHFNVSIKEEYNFIQATKTTAYIGVKYMRDEEDEWFEVSFDGRTYRSTSLLGECK